MYNKNFKKLLKNKEFRGSIYKDCPYKYPYGCGHGGIRRSHDEIDS